MPAVPLSGKSHDQAVSHQLVVADTLQRDQFFEPRLGGCFTMRASSAKRRANSTLRINLEGKQTQEDAPEYERPFNRIAHHTFSVYLISICANWLELITLPGVKSAGRMIPRTVTCWNSELT